MVNIFTVHFMASQCEEFKFESALKLHIEALCVFLHHYKLQVKVTLAIKVILILSNKMIHTLVTESLTYYGI